ncbi:MULTISPECIES: phosphoglucomutase/phosphomannomutase family protein [unclassified Halobacterium]|jgi:phosphomannomutase|uniref:phosphoglucomutase/phosphomannomutase family protein n=1 Tax=unclassified Halobacterium TaxID=2668073 RepID=UPI001E3344D2|nr:MULTISPECIES: phosphoglucomutase/phosphomannomutase family protein [unclassified Halobacterium]MCD2200565.1 phosphoglucomutase/phosphomannomutase family protein [Halobacterium sp. KA-4]MCD2203143.1 phosphoglucomutase/phosphomannomutase family protein [Halobacterium sp. KA-6]
MDGISFGTDGWRATLDVFTSGRVRSVAQATADYLANEGHAGETVAVGYDARETSEGFAEDIAGVLAANGFDVLLPERDCPTPLVAHAIVERDLAGALVVTASHNPPEYNGVKFIPEDGAPALPEVTEAIEANLREPVEGPLQGDVREVDLVTPHAEHCRDLVDADLSGLTVVYDAMHGSGRGVTDALLKAAGAEVIRERCDRDPEFGGTPPEPDEANLQGLALAVDQHDADFGVANDGDADRVAVVTPERGVLDGNRFYALAYDYLLESDTGPAVRTVSTTFLVDRLADVHDCEVVETPVGFKWVADAMGAHDALFGGEESGGYTMRGHVREKDGVLMALLAGAAASERPLDDRLDAIADEFGDIHQDKVSVDCPDDRKAAVLDELEDRLPDEIAGVLVERVNDTDGFKILLEDGSWLLVRPSGTEPKMRVYAEGDSPERVDDLLAAGRDLVEPLV